MTASPRARADDDAALIEQSLREPEAFAGLYDRHASSLYRYVARRLGDEVAEDVVAEAFLDAFRHRHRYDTSRGDARPWLYGIAANLIGKHRRTELRLWRALARTGVDPVAESMDERIDDRLSASAVRQQLAAALAGLADRDREVLLLIAWADLTYEQVADALDIPVGTVRSRLSRARRKVSAALGGYNPTSLIEEAFHE